MSKLTEIITKIRRKWTKLRLQPIRVFCFHQVSDKYDPEVYCKPDWIPSDFLKSYIEQLRAEGYEFISLAEAQAKMAKDKFRISKYAVLTADDGLRCQLELLPWLEEQRIPITLFVNIETLDGDTCGCVVKKYFAIKDRVTELKHAKKLYFTKDDIEHLPAIVSIGMHGITHDEVTAMPLEKFESMIRTCESALGTNSQYIPFYAYTYGMHNNRTDEELRKLHVTSVLADGGVNYDESNVIHREILEYIYKCQNQVS